MMEGVRGVSDVTTVRGEGELALLSRSVDLAAVCWKTLGDSRTEDTAVVVAVIRGGPATCRGTMDNRYQVQKPAARPKEGNT